MKNNKGYTLVEALIVIAIMAILAAGAGVTLGVIKEAKYNAAINTFENHLSSLWIKTKALSQGKVQSSPTSADESATYPLGMVIRRNRAGTDDGVKDGSYELILGYDKSGTFVEKETVSILTNIISIQYETSHTSTEPTTTLTVLGDNNSVNQVYIQFNKSDGSVKYGAGSYKILYNDRVVGTVHLDKFTGNHYVK